MKTLLSEAREECRLDYAAEEQGQAIPSSAGRKWAWRGKHRLDEAGKFVCGYKSWRQASDREKVRGGGHMHRDSLARDQTRGWDQFERGTAAGTVCKLCGRLIESVVTHEEWLAYQDFRERHTSYGGGAAKGYRGWFEPGVHGKGPGGKASWKGKHAGGVDEGFRCLYITVLRRKYRIAEEAGGCERCGRLRSEGQSE